MPARPARAGRAHREKRMQSNLDYELRFVTSDADLEAVYRLWYQICVAEMGRYQEVAEHAHERLVADGAGGGLLLGAFRRDGAAVGTLRLRSGKHRPFPDEYQTLYDLPRFADLITPAQMCVLDRMMILPEYRTTLLPLHIFFEIITDALRQGLEVAFCDCEPHLLNVYYRLGLRNHAPGFYRPSFGYMIPLMLIRGDAEQQWRVRSPLLAHVGWPKESTELGLALARRLDSSVVVSELLTGDGDPRWERVVALCASLPAGSLFTGLSDAERRQCLHRSHLLRCRKGDRLITRGTAYNRTLFVVMDGVVEVHRPGRPPIPLARGEIFGELGLLMQSARTADVIAAGDDVQILTLSEGALRPLLEGESALTARLLRNLARILCTRLIDDR
jgi:hypothetical protein